MTLITKYRPGKLEDILGHAPQVKSLNKSVKDKQANSYLFTGPAGTGKTTMARILAEMLGCTDLVEIDAATNTGIDDMRRVTENLQYKPVGGGNKGIIVDEVHGLSKQAFDSLLKLLEEPPPWVFWFLCTTVPTKVPVAVRTRCHSTELKPIPFEPLADWLADIAEKEKLPKSMGKEWQDVTDLCAKEAQGSPRQALSNLASCSAVTSLVEARDLLSSAEGKAEAFDLAKLLARGGKWSEAQALLRALKDTNPESVRHVVRVYMTTVALNAKDERTAGLAIEKLDAFSQPFNSFDGASPLVLAVGKVLLSD